MRDRTETRASGRAAGRGGTVPGGDQFGGSLPEPRGRPSLEAVLVDEVQGRSLYAIVGVAGTDADAARPRPPWSRTVVVR